MTLENFEDLKRNVKLKAKENHFRHSQSLTRLITIAEAARIRRAAINAIDQNHRIGDCSSEERESELEMQIRYYVHEIALYRLDVRGYKKDLKAAKESIRQSELACFCKYYTEL
jgi:hypothetical protein